MTRVTPVIANALLLGLLVAVAPEARAQLQTDVTIERLDGTLESARLVGLGAKSITLLRDGRSYALPRQQVTTLTWPYHDDNPPVRPRAFFADGSVLRATLVRLTATTLTLQTASRPWVQAFDVPAGRVRAIELLPRTVAPGPVLPLRECEALFTAASARDLLLLRRRPKAEPGGPQPVATLAGVVTEITREKITLRFDGRARTLARDRVYAIRFADAAPPEKPVSGRHGWVTLVDGTRMLGAEFAIVNGGLTFSRPAGARFSVPGHLVQRLELISDRLVWLDTLVPTVDTEFSQTFLGRAARWRMNAAMTGGPLFVRGRAYPRGLGCQARCRLTFALPGPVMQFIAKVGVDAAAGRHGRVVFRVRAGPEGAVLAESPPLTAADEPYRFALALAAATRLTLELDWAGNLGVGAHGDWLEARVVRVAAAAPDNPDDPEDSPFSGLGDLLNDDDNNNKDDNENDDKGNNDPNQRDSDSDSGNNDNGVRQPSARSPV